MRLFSIQNRKFYVFWAGQTVSTLGSAMTSFALTLWAYERSGAAMTVSLMSFSYFLPSILLSFLAGGLVDSMRKKTIMLVSDSVACLGSLLVCALALLGKLDFWHIYLVNFVNGAMNAVQAPAASVAVGMLAGKENIERATGLNSTASSLVGVFAPALASVLYAFGGLPLVLALDLTSFLFAASTLLFWIPLPEDGLKKLRLDFKAVWQSNLEGYRYLLARRGILYMILSLALMNLFSRIGFENLLTPMIVARSGSEIAAGTVNACLSAAGVLGGLLVTAFPPKRNRVYWVYLGGALSFLLGEFLCGIGRNTFVWCLSAFGGSLPICYLNAASLGILYNAVPEEAQGRVFAARNGLQFFTIPIGLLLGGYLADNVATPFIEGGSQLSAFFRELLGPGNGGGMALVFLATGVCASLSCLLWLFSRRVRELN